MARIPEFRRRLPAEPYAIGGDTPRRVSWFCIYALDSSLRPTSLPRSDRQVDASHWDGRDRKYTPAHVAGNGKASGNRA